VTDNKRDFGLLNDKYVGVSEGKKSDNKDKREKERYLAGIGIATDLGFAIAIPLTGGALLGSYLDDKLRTTPKLTLSLIFLGLIISFLNVYNIIKREIES